MSVDNNSVRAVACGRNDYLVLMPTVRCAAGPCRRRPRMHEVLTATQAPGWVLCHEGYNVLSESGIESRFALGNGFIGMRAARSVSRGPTWVSWLGHIKWASWPRCYVAGLFDRPNTEPPVPALVPVADWSRVRIKLNGQPDAAARRRHARRRAHARPPPRPAAVGTDASHPCRHHRHGTRTAPPVIGGPRSGAAAPSVLAWTATASTWNWKPVSRWPA